MKMAWFGRQRAGDTVMVLTFLLPAEQGQRSRAAGIPQNRGRCVWGSGLQEVHIGVEGESVLWTEASRVSLSPDDAWVPLVGEALSSGRRGRMQEVPEGPTGA